MRIGESKRLNAFRCYNNEEDDLMKHDRGTQTVTPEIRLGFHGGGRERRRVKRNIVILQRIFKLTCILG